MPDHNPLGKVPVLIMDDGTSLFDSRVIVEYLDSVNPVSRLIPESNRRRIMVKRWEALADGICDAAAAVFLERKRQEAQQSQEWISRQQKKVTRGLEAASRELGDKKWCDGNVYTLGGYCTGLRAGLPGLSLSRNRMARQLPQSCGAFRKAGKTRTIHGNSAPELEEWRAHAHLISDNSTSKTYIALVNHD